MDLNTTTVLQPTRDSQRVAAQAGWHTIQSIHNGHKIVPALNRIESELERLVLISIDKSSGRGIRRELKDMGIDSATVYGDLSSVCREIEDDLGIAPGQRRDSEYWIKKQDGVVLHVLALLLINGVRLIPGQSYR